MTQGDDPGTTGPRTGSVLRHTKHIFRAGFMLIICFVAVILGRELFVPDTWGQFGAYRGANVAEQRDKPVMHQGDAECQACHVEAFEEHAEAEHANVRCETCHAPLPGHAVDGEKAQEMPVRRSRDLCLRCHRQLQARPAGFAQIQPRQHVADNGGDWGEQVCLECHPPHAPL